MPKLNRGDVTKLSIRLTEKADKEIKKFGKNLNLSKAGVILFTISKILKEKPDMNTLLNLQQKYELEPKNFALTIKKELAAKINEVNEHVDMNKNIWIGLLISDYFETGQEGVLQQARPKSDTDKVQIKVEINTELKKKIVDYSENQFISLSGLVSYAFLNGPYNSLPQYQSHEKEFFFTTVPNYIYMSLKDEADEHIISDFFYMELCLYNAFMGENKIFD